MKVIAIALTGAALLAAGSAAASTASEKVSDLDYLKANRCKGIATATGADTAALDSYLKAAERGRSTFVIERGDAEMARGKHDAKSSLKDRAAVELSGACTAYMGAGKDVAAR